MIFAWYFLNWRYAIYNFKKVLFDRWGDYTIPSAAGAPFQLQWGYMPAMNLQQTFWNCCRLIIVNKTPTLGFYFIIL
jgi:hypothetical protein